MPNEPRLRPITSMISWSRISHLILKCWEWTGPGTRLAYDRMWQSHVFAYTIQPAVHSCHTVCTGKGVESLLILPWFPWLSPNWRDRCTKNVADWCMSIPYSQEQSSVLLPKPVPHHCYHTWPTCRLLWHEDKGNQIINSCMTLWPIIPGINGIRVNL